MPTYTRRAVLRAAGVCLTLPVLPSFARRLGAADKPAEPEAVARRGRFVAVYKAHGVCNEAWYPKEFGPAFPETPSLEPLKGLKDRATFLSGLSHLRCPDAVGHDGVDTFLTGENPSLPRPVSADQVFAAAVGGATRFPSLQLGTKSGTGVAHASFTLSYNAQGVGLPAENDPRRVFQRLFGEDTAASKADHARRLAARRSVLDAVADQSKAVAGELSAADKRQLDAYLQAVREVEVRVGQNQAWLDRPKPKADPAKLKLDAAIARNKTEFLRTMYDLAALALRTDSTRVVTFVTSPEGGNSEGWPECGYAGSHHGLQHHMGSETALAKLAEIDKVEVGLLAAFLKTLAETDDGDGKLLDRTAVLYGSGMNNGTVDYKNGRGGHGSRRVPLVVAGGEQLGLRQGKHLDFPGDKTTQCDLFVTLLRVLGVPTESFRDGTTTLNGLT